MMCSRVTILALLLAALAALLLFSKWARPAASPLRPPATGVPSAPIVEPVAVTVGSILDTVQAVGTLEARQSIMLRPEIAGLVKRVLFRDGQAVRQDDVLIELDDAELSALVAQAAAELKVARLTHARMKHLRTEGRFVSEQQLDEAFSKLQTAEANHVLYVTRLAKTKIRAPFDGHTGIRRIAPGDFIQPGQDLVNLEDLRSLVLDFKTPETVLSKLSVGQEVRLVTDAYPEQVFLGRISALDPRVDAVNRAVRARADIPNTEGLLRPGLFANVTLEMGRTDQALLIPEEAVIVQQARSFVYRLAGGTAQWTEVILGARKRGVVQVLSGLAATDRVVRVGHEKLKDGARVDIAAP